MQTLNLSDAEAELFLLFREHQDIYTVLLNAGVFNVRNGSVEIHFDSEGTLSNIAKHEVVFKRQKIVI